MCTFQDTKDYDAETICFASGYVWLWDSLLLWGGEYKFHVFKIEVLKRICEPKRDELVGEWNILHNEALRYLYSSADVRRVIWTRLWLADYVAQRETRSAYILNSKIETGR